VPGVPGPYTAPAGRVGVSDASPLPQYVALIEFELPCAFVSCTETEVSGAVLLENVNGMVSEKLLPYAAEAVL